MSFWKALIKLYRLLVLPWSNMDLLPIDPVKNRSRFRPARPNPTNLRLKARISHPRSKKSSNLTNRPPLESSPQAEPIFTIISITTATVKMHKHSSGRGPREKLTFNAVPSMIIVTSKISKSDHFNDVIQTVGTIVLYLIINSARPGALAKYRSINQPHQCRLARTHPDASLMTEVSISVIQTVGMM